ncbi:DUF4174 domain-containing protein [Pararhizobium sp. LjRoot235]|uniref:DUF4174 domain-containing protein n=1 Tax=Pararhizobium sp. LjRoot235 TaxID=3342291 RepID=UPI003ECC882D
MLKSLTADVFGMGVDPQHGGESLVDFEWRYRVLVIFPGEDRGRAMRQANMLLADTGELGKRDLIVLEVDRDDVKVLFGPQHDLNAYAIRYDLDVADDAFALLLVGKDGLVKLRSEDVVPVSTIFELIDQAPTRKASG